MTQRIYVMKRDEDYDYLCTEANLNTVCAVAELVKNTIVDYSVDDVVMELSRRGYSTTEYEIPIVDF